MITLLIFILLALLWPALIRGFISFGIALIVVFLLLMVVMAGCDERASHCHNATIKVEVYEELMMNPNHTLSRFDRSDYTRAKIDQAKFCGAYNRG